MQFADTFAKLLILFEITKYLSKKTYLELTERL